MPSAPSNVPPPEGTPATSSQNTVSSNAAKFNLSTPETTVRSLVAAINRSDLRGATHCVLGASSTTAGLKELEAEAHQNPATFLVSDLKTIVNGERAMVTLKLSVPISPSSTRRETVASKLKLTRQDGSWKITPAPISILSSYSGTDYLYFVATLLRHPDAGQKATYEAICARNMRSLFVAYVGYHDAHNGAPLNPSEFKKEILPFLKSAATLHCPADTTGQVSYRYNAAGSQSFGIVKASNLNRTVLFYEGQNGKLDFRHDGIAHVVTADGEMRGVNRQQAQTLLWARQKAK